MDALMSQAAGRNAEIIVVNDGSTDATADVVGRHSGVRLITQANAGPAAARNRGVLEAHCEIILFTDDDCVPTPNWIDAMIEPFEDPEVVGAKGVYRTLQKQLTARFVQIEYEDRYRLMAGLACIDFVDTYSAAFRRDRFLEMNGYDTSFPMACAEDVELSYRMSARGWKMVFAPAATVYHTHPDTLWGYLRKKYKFAFWRVLAVRKNPSKALKDTHTPQLMKLQLLFGPTLVLAVVVDLIVKPAVSMSTFVAAAFLVSTLPFALRAAKSYPLLGLLSPALLALRACAQGLGVISGLIYALRRPPAVSTKSAA
jgi:GT2 family glycosyltransferase